MDQPAPTRNPLRAPGARLPLWRTRRPAAALCAALAAFLTIQVLRAPGPPTTPLLVARHDLPAGTALTAADLAHRALPTAGLPGGGTDDESALIGARTAVAVPAGLPLVSTLLADTPTTAPPGTVAVPVRFADDAVAALLAPGRRIDVVSAPPGAEPRTLATGALVLAGAEPAPGGLLGGSSTENGPLLLAVDPEEAVPLSAAGASTGLSAILVE